MASAKNTWAKSDSLFIKLPLAKAKWQFIKHNALDQSLVTFVWSTKDRHPYLTSEIREKVFEHIRQNAREKGIHIDFINGYIDHVHCLISLGTDHTLGWIMQSIRGESSFWINKNKLTKMKFAWQDEYFVVSVNESTLPGVRKYIANQEEHHKTVSIENEFENFLKRAGFQKFNDSD